MKLNLPFGWGRLWFVRDKGQAFHAKSLFHTNLKLRHFRDGIFLEERDLGSGVVTTLGVRAIAAEGTTNISTIHLVNWHDSGTGSAIPGIADVALQTPTGSPRSVGSQSNVFNVYQSVANISYTSNITITEWGVWTALSGGTLFDRRTFTGQPVLIGDVLQWIYQLTVVPGG